MVELQPCLGQGRISKQKSNPKQQMLPSGFLTIFTGVVKVQQLYHDMESENRSLLFYTSVRWFSPGRFLTRFFSLHQEVEMFLDVQRKRDWRYSKFSKQYHYSVLFAKVNGVRFLLCHQTCVWLLVLTLNHN